MRIELKLDDDRVFTPGRRAQMIAAGARREAAREVEIEFFRRQHGRSIIKLRGIDSINAAEAWIGAEIRILASEIAPEEGWFYTFQLKGCRVFTESGDDLGTVTDVLDPGGVEILQVERDNEETLIPFAKAFVKSIDLDGRRIEVELPEGLRELNK
jgi:16S rRNA processing protein RimM